MYVLEFLCLVLSVFEVASTTLSGELYPTFLLPPPQLKRLEKLLERVDLVKFLENDIKTKPGDKAYEQSVQLCEAVRIKLLDEFDKRFPENNVYEIMNWAPLFHPIFANYHWQLYFKSDATKAAMKRTLFKLLENIDGGRCSDNEYSPDVKPVVKKTIKGGHKLKSLVGSEWSEVMRGRDEKNKGAPTSLASSAEGGIDLIPSEGGKGVRPVVAAKVVTRKGDEVARAIDFSHEFEKYLKYCDDVFENETKCNENSDVLFDMYTHPYSVCNFWQEIRRKNLFRKLQPIARYVMSIICSSAPSERVFSTAGNTVTKKRSSLGPERVNAIVTLNKANLSLTEKETLWRLCTEDR